MQIFGGPGVSRGQEYVPDEVAKALVADKKLKKGDSISKGEIIAFLASKELSPLLATDVAMVLRNLFGVTPIFYEETMSDKLIGELTLVLEDRETVVEDETLNLGRVCHEAFVDLFCEARDEEDELIAAKLATMDVEDIADIAELADYLGEEELDIIESCLMTGGTQLAESALNVFARPHSLKFLSEEVATTLVEQFSMTRELRRRGLDASGSKLKPPKQNPKKMRRADRERMIATKSGVSGNVASDPNIKRHLRGMSAASDHDPLMQRQQKAAAANAAAMHAGQDFKGAMSMPGAKGELQKHIADLQAQRRAKEGLPAKMLRAGKKAIGAIGDVAKAAHGRVKAANQAAKGAWHKTGSELGMPGYARDAEPTHGVEPAKKPGLLSRFVRGAGRVVGGIARGIGAVGSDVGRGALRAAGKVGGHAASGAARGLGGVLGRVAGDFKAAYQKAKEQAAAKSPGLRQTIGGSPPPENASEAPRRKRKKTSRSGFGAQEA
jgi:hypothetical protein